MKHITIQSGSGSIAATQYDAEKAKALLIIASATGVKQTYYRKFAEHFADQGFTVITFDYLGIGGSLQVPIKTLTHEARDWGRHDLEGVIRYALSTHPNLKKYLLGHSIGGQLIGFSESSLQLDKIILVAAQSGYWRYWQGVGRVKMWFNWYVLFPVLLRWFGYLPSKSISGMENLPKGVAEQWSTWGKKKDYLLSEVYPEATVFDQVSAEVTAFSIDDDDYAPEEAVNWLSSKFSSARVKRIHLTPKAFQTKRIGHFGFFKAHFKNDLWPLVLNEMQ